MFVFLPLVKIFIFDNFFWLMRLFRALHGLPFLLFNVRPSSILASNISLCGCLFYYSISLWGGSGEVFLPFHYTSSLSQITAQPRSNEHEKEIRASDRVGSNLELTRRLNWSMNELSTLRPDGVGVVKEHFLNSLQSKKQVLAL